MKSSESDWKSLPTLNFSWTRHDEHAAESLQILMIQLFLERLSYQRGKPYATMSKVIMGSGVAWANTKVFQPSGKNSTNTCIRSFSFLVAESPWTSITQSQTLTTINANRHRRARFHTFVGQPLSKQLYPELSITSLFWGCVHSAHMLFLVSQILDAVDLNSIADALMSWISWPHISFGRKILESR